MSTENEIIKYDEFLNKMLLDKKYASFKENEIFDLIDELEQKNKLEECSKIFLCYVNLVMNKTHAIELDKNREFLQYIRRNKSDKLNEEVKGESSIIRKCAPILGMQRDELYY